MNPAREAFENELNEALIDARGGFDPVYKIRAHYADRLIELARRVINEE